MISGKLPDKLPKIRQDVINLRKHDHAPAETDVSHRDATNKLIVVIGFIKGTVGKSLFNSSQQQQRAQC